MARENRVDNIGPGNPFRDWLLQVLHDRISDWKCKVNVYKITPSSHTVCRYEFPHQGFSVVAKFYGEPTGWKKNYNPVRAMENEYNTLKKMENIVDAPKPLAINKDFHCVLLTEHLPGRSLFKYLEKEDGLYDRLTAIAHLQRRLHDQTRSYYRKEREFASFHKVLDELRLDASTRMKYNRLLGDWWYKDSLNFPFGCRVHDDANPMNYLFNGNKVFMIDFENSREQANYVRDLGIMAAEIKHFFAIHRNNSNLAEQYIGHYLWKYAHNESEFYAITRALPFFMSQGLLRMARLNLGARQKAYIFQEAKACLEGGLRAIG